MSARKYVIAAVAAIAAVPAVAGPANAASDPTQINLIGGSLAFGTPLTANNFADLTLNGTIQTVNAEVNDWSVNDSTGSLLGWNVTAQASQFTDDNGTPGDNTDDKTLPTASLSLSGGTPAAGAGQSALLAPIVQPLGTPIDGGAAVPVAIAALGKGQGLWNFAQDADDLTLVVPPTAEEGTYTSTITTTLTSGITP